MEKTTIAITNVLWRALNEMRKDSSETFEDVIWNLIAKKEKKDGKRQVK